MKGDLALRQLERARHSAERSERVGLLHEARRRGEPGAEASLRLAAYLGEPSAREALGLPLRVRCEQLAGCVIDLSGHDATVRGDHDRACPLPSLFDFDRYTSDLAGFGARFGHEPEQCLATSAQGGDQYRDRGNAEQRDNPDPGQHLAFVVVKAEDAAAQN